MKRLNICIFGGTTEGKMLAELLSSLNVEADLFIDEEYGHKFIKNLESISVHLNEMDETHMINLFKEKKYNLVIDATDSFNNKVSKSILKTSVAYNVKYVQIVNKLLNLKNYGRSGDPGRYFIGSIDSAYARRNTPFTACLSVEEICDYVLSEMYCEKYACV